MHKNPSGTTKCYEFIYSHVHQNSARENVQAGMYPDLAPIVEDDKKEHETGIRKVDSDFKRENLLVKVKEDKGTMKDLHDSFEKNGTKFSLLTIIFFNLH